MKNIYILLIVVLAVALGAFFFMSGRDVEVSPDQDGTSTATSTDSEVVQRTLTVPEYGFSLASKGGEEGYVLVQHEDAQRGDLVYSASLFDAREYESFLQNSTAGEAPVSLNIAVYRNPMNLSAEEWIESTPESNFNLSTDGNLTTDMIGGTEYQRYTWDGLYRADAYVTAKDGYVYVFANQWMDEVSSMRADMEEVLASVVFTEPTALASVAHGDIRVNTPQPGATVSSPIEITGEARGYWFFEASFPIVLVDWDGRIIAEGFATAEGEWMTEDFVPFSAELEFSSDSVPSFNTRGALILKRDNPSGLPENDDAIEIPLTLQ